MKFIRHVKAISRPHWWTIRSPISKFTLAQITKLAESQRLRDKIIGFIIFINVFTHMKYNIQLLLTFIDIDYELRVNP